MVQIKPTFNNHRFYLPTLCNGLWLATRKNETGFLFSVFNIGEPQSIIQLGFVDGAGSPLGIPFAKLCSAIFSILLAGTYSVFAY